MNFKKLIKPVSVLGAAISLMMPFLLGVSLTGESYNIFDPYADTEFARGYTAEKFHKIQIGATARQVRQQLGWPLYKGSSSHCEPWNSKNCFETICYDYTNDGYLKRRTDKKYALATDLAWYRSIVEFSKDSTVVRLDEGWSYD